MNEETREAARGHTERLLEFSAIRDALAGRCLSPAGAKHCREIVPSDDAHEVTALLDRTAEYRLLLAEGEEPNSLAFPDLSEALSELRVEGGQLEGEQLYATGIFIASFFELREWLAAPERNGLLPSDLADLVLPKELADSILHLIDESGHVREERVPELKRIRESIRGVQDEIARRVRSYFNDSANEQLFSSDAPAYREGRTVLPVKSDFKGRIPGVVHDVSSTGQTVFVEPFDIVEQNNARAELESEYRNVIRRILREFSHAAFAEREALREAEYRLAVLDAIRARARYSIDFDCVRPGRADRIRLRQARHPLLPRREVVPVDIVMDEPVRCLIVTGPNTGGKTVALKTVGLLSLMHQSGMEIPAGTGSELPLFDAVLGDIGDEQSLEQNLSTFSGHMQNISAMLESATVRSLLLLDELGSGTDPHEGGALAMAMLDTITDRGSFALVTTHHGALKRYGYTHEGVANASMEFDESSLAPTYRLLVGVPGSSHALSIAARNGVKEDVLGRARAYLTDGTSDTAQVLRALEQSQADLERDRSKVVERERALAARDKDLAEREDRMRRQRDELREGKLRDVDRFAAEARRTLENLVRELREGQIDSEKTRAVKRYIRDLGEQSEQLRSGESQSDDETRDSAGVPEPKTSRGERPVPKKPRSSERSASVSPGSRVRLKKYGTEGVVERKGKAGQWLVAAGSLKVSVSEEDLEVLDSPSSAARTGRRFAGEAAGSDAGTGSRGGHAVETTLPDIAVSFEIDIRGKRVAEALDLVERQIDDCLARGQREFTVLHGKGTGALQKSVHDLLSKRVEVASGEFARPEEGGTGKTVVTLHV